MKNLRIIAGILFCLLAGFTNAQTPIDIEIRTLLFAQKYPEVVAFADRSGELSDSSLYRIGRAYFRMDDTLNARMFFDRTIAKNPRYQNAYYFRGILNYYSEQYQVALSDVNQAIALDSTDADYFYLKGDISWSMGNLDQAIEVFQKAIQLKNCSLNAWLSIGEIYSEQEKPEKAAQAFRDALPKVAKDTTLYMRALYNLGATEYLNEHFPQAKEAFEELLKLSPDDYRALSKLIQVHYAQQNYKAADPLKAKLYRAWNDKKMPKSMKDDFCFDQFMWNGKRVFVYERFAEDEDLYYKHVFYITDKEGNTEFQVQTEYSFAIAMSGKKYTLGMTKGGKHYTFIQFLFDDKPDYDELKKSVLKILDEKVKASSSSTTSKN